MPHLPFTTTSSAASNPPTAQPSIVLHVAPEVSPSSSDPISQSTAHISSAYRQRYASYLAATLNISLEAAQSETDYQLSPRRASEVSEGDACQS
ncbi:hypothetical protein K432DRAFT_387057 [Lepidopterella palustris CBS 459.81]|uniref:Uncharacterized protein n=1 Tax=Lepidopterella palustris CBS 459.81 TaxID=1314670 RepID=A0A8E2DYF6_9PEZI|nr:hypothetical protein K432DRAFT_387057 [Lepidopterella palustris CBS 459.81]